MRGMRGSVRGERRVRGVRRDVRGVRGRMKGMRGTVMQGSNGSREGAQLRWKTLHRGELFSNDRVCYALKLTPLQFITLPTLPRHSAKSHSALSLCAPRCLATQSPASATSQLSQLSQCRVRLCPRGLCAPCQLSVQPRRQPLRAWSP